MNDREYILFYDDESKTFYYYKNFIVWPFYAWASGIMYYFL